MSEHNLDFMFLTKAWLGPDGATVLNEICPPDYTYLYSIREGKKGVGLASI